MQKARELGEQTTLVDWSYRWHLAQARFKEFERDLETARILLDEAGCAYVETPIPDARQKQAWKAKIYLKQGRLVLAQERSRERGLTADDEISYLGEFEHLILTRVMPAEYQSWRRNDSILQAIGLLERLLKAAEAQRRTGSVIEDPGACLLGHRRGLQRARFYLCPAGLRFHGALDVRAAKTQPAGPWHGAVRRNCGSGQGCQAIQAGGSGVWRQSKIWRVCRIYLHGRRRQAGLETGEPGMCRSCFHPIWRYHRALFLDMVPGKSSFTRYQSSLNPHGLYLAGAGGLESFAQMAWTELTGGKKVRAGMAPDRAEDLLFLKELLAAGKLKPVIDRCYPLEQTADAHRYADTGHKRGSLVITITAKE